MGKSTLSMNKTNCDVCGSSKRELFLKVKKHEYQSCLKCKTIYLSTRAINLTKTRDNTYLEDVDGYLSIINPHGTRYMAGKVDEAAERLLGGEKGELLEVGSGLGHLSYTLFARGWDVKSLELSHAAVRWQQKAFKLPVSEEKIEEYEGDSYKAFVMVEVVEHFYDPLLALKHLKKLGDGKAMVFGTTPNTDSAHWKSGEQDIYQPHDHIVLFNKKNLQKLLKKAGLKNIHIEYFGGGEKNDSNLMYSGRF